MNTIRKVILLAGTILPLHLLHAQTVAETQAQLQALEQTEPTPAAAVPRSGQFYPASLANRGIFAPILPPGLGLPAWNLGDGAWLVDDLEPVAPLRMGMRTMGLDSPPAPGGGGGDGDDTNTYNYVPPDYGTNLCVIQAAISNGWLAALGSNTVADVTYSYGIESRTNLLQTDWQMEAVIPATTSNTVPFCVAQAGRGNLFVQLAGMPADAWGVPMAWYWNWFGNLNESATNLDASGNSLAYDYSNNLPPTVFQFTGVEVTNNYVASSSTTVQLEVSGRPYYVAVSMDDTNFANDSVWNEYASANVTVNLGLTEGWHDVWIGLRGHGDDPTNAVWQWTRLKLDYTPPVIVITGPTNGTVAVPMIQLTGYSPEALASISYDLSNAVSTLTYQPVFITGQNFSTNTWEFTTNVFQGFDVSLTNGLNTITLQATDLAGNVTTTNFTFTVNYNDKTNPPLTQVYWPLNGQKVCGTSFLCQGWVGDPTVSVRAELVDTNQDTNTYAANVGRDGHFWLENLPLSGGTNWLTLTVTDVASNTFATNLMILSGDAGLNIDPVVAGQTTVTGEINASNVTVWVNGAQATNNGYGSWTAAIAPISGTGGAVEAVAIPNNDHDGNGSGGTDAAGNPLSAQGQSVQAAVSSPQGVYLVSSAYQNQEDYWGNDSIEIGSGWADAAGGWMQGHSFNGSTLDTSINWPTNPWPAAVSEGVLWVTNNGQFELTTHRPASISFHYASEQVQLADPVTGSAFVESAEGALNFAAGGPLGSTVWRLYQFSGSVTIHHHPQPPDSDEVPWSIPADDETVADARVTLGSAGKLDANGNAYALVADNSRVDATPSVKGADDYSFPSPTVSEVTLTGLTVVSNAPVYQIDATNWACVKTATDDWVYIKATLSTDDTNAANQIIWTSTGSPLLPVPGDPFQRRLTKTSSVESIVTATLGSASTNLNVWVIWSTIAYQFSGSNPSPLLFADTIVHFTDENLGVEFFNSNYWGKMCAVATITPTGAHEVVSNGWTFVQAKMTRFYVNKVVTSDSTYPNWAGDSTTTTASLDSNDKLYLIDGPNLPPLNGASSDESYQNFRNVVLYGNTICTDTNYFWHWEARQATSVDATNLGSGTISIPTSSYYQ